MFNLFFSIIIFLISNPTYAEDTLIHPFTSENPQLDFLSGAIGGRSIVQLGEGIHITREFPTIRLEFVKYLHEQLGFDVIAYEGSAVDSWIAEDDLLHGDSIENVQLRAWFPLWQTKEMGKTLEYIKSTLSTPHPLYLASFDIQLGSGRAFGGGEEDIIASLVSHVNAYGGELTTEQLQPLLQLQYCHRNPVDSLTVSSSIKALSKAIQQTSVKIKNLSHQKMLQLLPENLTARLNHCLIVSGKEVGKLYQEERDRANAKMVLSIKQNVTENHKVILWAHHSHVHHNALKEHPYSMGESLKEKNSNDLYTIGFFAGSGTMLSVSDQDFIPISHLRIHPSTSFEFERSLKELGQDLFMVNLDKVDPATLTKYKWDQKIDASIEGINRYSILPAQDFNAIVYVDTVSAADLNFLGPVMKWVGYLYGFWKNFRFWIVSILLLLTVLTIFKFLQKRRRN